VLKMINLASEPCSSDLKLAGLPPFAPGVAVTTLTSSTPTDNNSLDAPRAVTPKFTTTQINGSSFNHELPPHSLTVLRFRKP